MPIRHSRLTHFQVVLFCLGISRCAHVHFPVVVNPKNEITSVKLFVFYR